jgi:hypothetical protein
LDNIRGILPDLDPEWKENEWFFSESMKFFKISLIFSEKQQRIKKSKNTPKTYLATLWHKSLTGKF